MTKWYKKYIASVPILLNLALLIAVISLFVMESFLLDIPEVFSGAEALGKVYYKLCISMMASYLFYFIVIHLKTVKDKENINTFVGSKVKAIIDNYKAQIKGLVSTVESFSGKDELSPLEIQRTFSRTNEISHAPLYLSNLGEATWLQFFKYYKKETEDDIKKLYIKIQFLDSELIALLAEIDNSQYYKIIDVLASIHPHSCDVSTLSSFFYNHSILCKQLEEYYDKNLSAYTIV